MVVEMCAWVGGPSPGSVARVLRAHRPALFPVRRRVRRRLPDRPLRRRAVAGHVLWRWRYMHELQ